MKIPWNKNYLIIGFHVALTAVMIFLAGLLLYKFPVLLSSVLSILGTVCATLTPLFLAIFISMLLNRPVDFWERQIRKVIPKKKEETYPSRKPGTLAVYLIGLLVIALIATVTTAKAGSMDTQSLSDQFSLLMTDISDLFVYLNVKLAELGVLQELEGQLAQWSDTIQVWIQHAITAFAASLPKAGGTLLDLVIALTISFYFLMEKDRLLAFWKKASSVFFGQRITGVITSLSNEIYTVFTGYLGGQMLDAIIMAFLISVSFQLIGIPYAVPIGIISGFSNLIPYFGAIMAFILSVLMGFLSGAPIKALYAAIIVIILQQVDSIFFVPRIVGKSVELHPVMVLISLAVFGGLFGFVGMLFAVPLGALCKDFFFWIYRKKESVQK